MGQTPEPFSPDREPAPFAPLPVAPLSYDAPMYHQRGRPGILTAVGVMSIILACLAGLTNLWSIVSTAGMLAMSRSPMVTVTAPPPVVSNAPQPTVSGGMIVSPETDGLSPQQRAVVLQTITRHQPLDPQRVRQLDELLAQAGKQIFPVAADNADAKMIVANINERGMLPGVGGASGPYYFIVGAGRVEIYDDHAVFRPDGTPEYLSVSVPQPPVNVATTTATVRMKPSSGGYTTITTTSGGSTTTTVTSTGAAMPFMFPKISTTAATTTIVEATLSLLLAVYLFVIGIMVLNDSRRGGKLHWIFVFLKIPLVIVASIATFYLWTGWTSGMMPPGATPPRAFGGVMAAGAIISAGMALAYPVALIFVLMSRTVRDYYSSANG